MSNKSSEKEKICSCCEGRISADVRVCPYCATAQDTQSSFEGKEKEEPVSSFRPHTLQDSLAALYAPPYGQRAKSLQEEATFPVESPYSHAEVESSLGAPYKTVFSTPPEDPLASMAKEGEEKVTPKHQFLPLLLLFGGAHALILGVMLLLFARGGVLLLEWRANTWPFYLIASAVLLFWGRKELKKLKE